MTDQSLDQKEDNGEAQANNATSSKDPFGGTDPFQNSPLPTLLECCQCSRSFNQEHGLPVRTSNVGVDHSRVLKYCSMIQEELKELSGAAKAKDWGEFLLELTDVLYLV